MNAARPAVSSGWARNAWRCISNPHRSACHDAVSAASADGWTLSCSARLNAPKSLIHVPHSERWSRLRSKVFDRGLASHVLQLWVHVRSNKAGLTRTRPCDVLTCNYGSIVYTFFSLLFPFSLFIRTIVKLFIDIRVGLLTDLKWRAKLRPSKLCGTLG